MSTVSVCLPTMRPLFNRVKPHLGARHSPQDEEQQQQQQQKQLSSSTQKETLSSPSTGMGRMPSIAKPTPMTDASNDHLTARHEETAFHVIFLKNSTSSELCDSATIAVKHLLNTMVVDKDSIHVHGSDIGTSFVTAPLTAANAEEVQQDPNVNVA